MADQRKKAKLALDEARLLILGAQILLGFQYRSFLESGFSRLPQVSQARRLTSLGLMLGTTLMLMWPSSFHEMVEQGRLSPRVLRFSTRVMSLALLPFAISLGVHIYTVVEKFRGARAGLATGAASALTALFFWFGWEYLQRAMGNGNVNMSLGENEKPPLHDRIDTVLTECRVVIPGSQALLGFQLIAVLTDGFDHLPPSSQTVHVASLLLITLSTVLLMAPAAYHRIVERGEDSERLWRFARVMLLAGMAMLAAGVATESFVVGRRVTQALWASIVSAGCILIVFYALWFGFPLYMRCRTPPGEKQ